MIQKKKYDTQYRIYSDVLKIKDTPVAFIEYWNGHIEDEEILDVSIGVINDEKYRHAGFASRMAERGNKEVEKIIKSGVLNKPIDRIIWGADSENSKSIQTAIKLGFEEDPTFEFVGDNGRTYKGLQKKLK